MFPPKISQLVTNPQNRRSDEFTCDVPSGAKYFPCNSPTSAKGTFFARRSLLPKSPHAKEASLRKTSFSTYIIEEEFHIKVSWSTYCTRVNSSHVEYVHLSLQNLRRISFFVRRNFANRLFVGSVYEIFVFKHFWVFDWLQ